MINIIDKQKCSNVILIANIKGDFRDAFQEIAKIMGGKELLPTNEVSANIEVPVEPFAHALRAKKPRNEKMSTYNPNESSLIIAYGNNGFIEEDKDMYLKELMEYEKYLTSKNASMVFMRGNEDNPKYFNEDMIHTECFQTLPDYSVIKTSEDNILCIGGAISFDRTWKEQQHERWGKRYFGEHELPHLDKDLLSTICTETPPSIVLTQIFPTFVAKNYMNGIQKWMEQDKTLHQDIIQTRLIMDNIYINILTHATLDTHISWFAPDFAKNHKDTYHMSFMSATNVRLITYKDVNQEQDMYKVSDWLASATTTFAGNIEHPIPERYERFNNYLQNDLNAPLDADDILGELDDRVAEPAIRAHDILRNPF